MSTFLLDTFTGSGDLSTHTGEIGATWTALYGTALTDFVLDGAGKISCPANTTPGAKASGVPATADFYVDVVLKFATLASFINQFYQAYVRLGAFNASPAELGHYVSIEVDPARDATIDLETGSDSGTDSSGNIVTTTALSYNTDITLRLAVTNSGKTGSVYADGVLLVSYTLANSPPACGLIELDISSLTAPGLVTVSSITGVENSVFWTNFVKTAET